MPGTDLKFEFPLGARVCVSAMMFSDRQVVGGRQQSYTKEQTLRCQHGSCSLVEVQQLLQEQNGLNGDRELKQAANNRRGSAEQKPSLRCW